MYPCQLCELVEKYIKEAVFAPNKMFADPNNNLNNAHELSITSQIEAQSSS